MQTLGRLLKEVELPPALLSPQMRQLRELLRQRLAQNPDYRFQNALEVRLAASLGVEIDVNLAREQDWLRLPGLTPAQAQQLVRSRQQGEFFASTEDVASTLGFPLERLTDWEPLLVYRYYAFPEPVDAPVPPPVPSPLTTDGLATAAPERGPAVLLNRASRPELLQVPGLDEALAERILHLRLMGGRFLDAEDFRRRLQLTPGQLSRWLPYLRF